MVNNNRALILATSMAARAKITIDARPPDTAPRHRTRKSTGREDAAVSPSVRRMQGRITLKDPDVVRRIIFDPSLETE